VNGSCRTSLGAALCAALCALLGAVPTRAESGRLLASGGATALEGSAGGGIVPWAVLSGYGTEDELGGALGVTRVHTDDFTLDAYGASFTLWNRLELSLAQHRFDARPYDTVLRQSVLGAKLRVGGDLIYTRWPQLSLGVQLKHNADFELPEAVRAKRRSGADAYVTASKLFLGGALGHSLLLSAGLRASRANQLGLLGFGGDRRGGYALLPEFSAALLLTHRAALGFEYREQPDNLRFAHTDAWRDIFAAYFVNKRLAIVAAYAQLGRVAGFSDQNGWYLSLQGSY
jgi:hypothetical protein